MESTIFVLCFVFFNVFPVCDFIVTSVKVKDHISIKKNQKIYRELYNICKRLWFDVWTFKKHLLVTFDIVEIFSSPSESNQTAHALHLHIVKPKKSENLLVRQMRQPKEEKNKPKEKEETYSITTTIVALINIPFEWARTY